MRAVNVIQKYLKKWFIKFSNSFKKNRAILKTTRIIVFDIEILGCWCLLKSTHLVTVLLISLRCELINVIVTVLPISLRMRVDSWERHLVTSIRWQQTSGEVDILTRHRMNIQQPCLPATFVLRHHLTAFSLNCNDFAWRHNYKICILRLL